MTDTVAPTVWRRVCNNNECPGNMGEKSIVDVV